MDFFWLKQNNFMNLQSSG